MMAVLHFHSNKDTVKRFQLPPLLLFETQTANESQPRVFTSTEDFKHLPYRSLPHLTFSCQQTVPPIKALVAARHSIGLHSWPRKEGARHCSNLLHHLSRRNARRASSRWRQGWRSSALEIRASWEDSVTASLPTVGDMDRKVWTEVLICGGLYRQHYASGPSDMFQTQPSNRIVKFKENGELLWVMSNNSKCKSIPYVTLTKRENTFS